MEQTPQAVRQCPMPVHTQGALRGGPMMETSPLPNTGRTQLTPSSLASLYTPITGHAANKMHPQLGVFLEQPWESRHERCVATRDLASKTHRYLCPGASRAKGFALWVFRINNMTILPALGLSGASGSFVHGAGAARSLRCQGRVSKMCHVNASWRSL